MNIKKFLTDKHPEKRKLAKLIIGLINDHGFRVLRNTITDEIQTTLTKDENPLTIELRLGWAKSSRLLRGFSCEKPNMKVSLFKNGYYIGGSERAYGKVKEIEEALEEETWFSLIC